MKIEFSYVEAKEIIRRDLTSSFAMRLLDQVFAELERFKSEKPFERAWKEINKKIESFVPLREKVPAIKELRTLSVIDDEVRFLITGSWDKGMAGLFDTKNFLEKNFSQFA